MIIKKCCKKTSMVVTPINASYGQPYIQSQIIGMIPLPKTSQDLTTLIYTLGASPVFTKFVQAWENKIHPNNVLLDNTYNIAISNGGSAFAAASFYYACQQQLGRSINITSNIPPPFYAYYKSLCNFVPYTNWIDWTEDSSGNYSFPTTSIDLLVAISPNNPTGEITSSIPSYSFTYLLVDTVYDNYLFTKTYSSVNSWAWDLMNNPKTGDPPTAIISSFSKFGFAGFRSGYLFTNTTTLLTLCQSYISTFVYGSSTFSVYNMINDNSLISSSYFYQVNKVLTARQREIRQYIDSSLILNTNSIAPYLFVKINASVFLNCNIIVQPGSFFLISDEYSRINLMLKSQDWKCLIYFIKTLLPYNQ